MAEYIDKKTAIYSIANNYCMNCENSNGILCRACEHQDDMDIIDSIPAADVKPVKHAKWVLFDKDCCGRAFYCSNCRKATTTDDFETTPLEHEEYFCPRCGADMRKQ